MFGRRYPRSRPLDTALETRLRTERVAWLGSTGPDGRPHLVPTWFWWDGEAFVIFSKPIAVKVRNVRVNPAVMLALGDADDDFDVQLVEGRAALGDPTEGVVVPAEMLAKYREPMAAIGLTSAEFAITYRQPIRIVPTRFLGWTGRSRLDGRVVEPRVVVPPGAHPGGRPPGHELGGSAGRLAAVPA
jgi:PPOX class probable F420-dependent enzyme